MFILLLNMTKLTVNGLVKKYFDDNPNREITQSEVVDYVFKYTPKARDPWRAVRALYQSGYLIQVEKGVYKRIPGYEQKSQVDTFSPAIKEAIFKRDNYRCVVCGNGHHNGYEIHADHIRPMSKSGKSTLENGQTLCSEHNMLKKNYGVVDFLKKYSEKMLKRAQELKDTKVIDFFKDILDVIKKHKM